MARRKVVRKQPLAERIASLPFDLWLSVSENIELFDWDGHAVPTALPLGAGCNVLLLLCRAYSSSVSAGQDEDELFSSKQLDAADVFNVPKRRPFFTLLFSTLTLALMVVCFGNAIYCYRKTRRYTLMGRSISNQPDTPSAHKVKYQDSHATPESPLKRMLSWQSAKSEGADQADDLWELNIWDPAKFNLYFGSTFSPLHAISIMYAPMSMFLLFLLAFLSVYLFGVNWRFLTMVKDRSILHSEVLGEYGKKVVQPTIYTKKRDVAVGTDGSIDTFSPLPLNRYVERDVRESKAPKLQPTAQTPWMSPIRPSSSVPMSLNLRQRASMNSLRMQPPAGYQAEPSPSVKRKSSIRPWKRDSDINASPLAKK